jgi:hypothetical protein
VKRHFRCWLWVLVILLTVSGRAAFGKSLAPFTEALISQYGLGDEDIKNLQFYISGDIVLQRTLAQGEAGVKGHTLRRFNNERVEEVKLKALTPGVVEFLSDHSLTVSFEPDANIEFCTKVTNSTNLTPTFNLCARRWEGTTGYLDYGGREFMSLPGGNTVCLMVDLKQFAKISKKSRTVKGRKL